MFLNRDFNWRFVKDHLLHSVLNVILYSPGEPGDPSQASFQAESVLKSIPLTVQLKSEENVFILIFQVASCSVVNYPSSFKKTLHKALELRRVLQVQVVFCVAAGLPC